jgi:hypothetical protein
MAQTFEFRCGYWHEIITQVELPDTDGIYEVLWVAVRGNFGSLEHSRIKRVDGKFYLQASRLDEWKAIGEFVAGPSSRGGFAVEYPVLKGSANITLPTSRDGTPYEVEVQAYVEKMTLY